VAVGGPGETKQKIDRGGTNFRGDRPDFFDKVRGSICGEMDGPRLSAQTSDGPWPGPAIRFRGPLPWPACREGWLLQVFPVRLLEIFGKGGGGGGGGPLFPWCPGNPPGKITRAARGALTVIVSVSCPGAWRGDPGWGGKFGAMLFFSPWVFVLGNILGPLRPGGLWAECWLGLAIREFQGPWVGRGSQAGRGKTLDRNKKKKKKKKRPLLNPIPTHGASLSRPPPRAGLTCFGAGARPATSVFLFFTQRREGGGHGRDDSPGMGDGKNQRPENKKKKGKKKASGGH